MKKMLLIAAAVFAFSNVQAQVGINTTDPKATLQIVGANDKGAVTGTDGILVPRVNALAVNGTEDGQLVYLIADAGTFKKGFHFWNATTAAWEPMAAGGGGALEKDDDESLFTPFDAYNNNGLYNIKIGRNAGNDIVDDDLNIMIGMLAGANNEHPGQYNVYLGRQAGYNTTTWGSNIAMGANSLANSTPVDGQNRVGFDNIAIGNSTLGSTVLKEKNIALGDNAGFKTEMVNGNLLLGVDAGANGTLFKGSSLVSENNIIGFEAGKQSKMQSFNTILGTKTAQDATVGERNFIQGYLVGKGADMFNKSTIASDNIIMGSSAALASNIGSDNIALGQNVLNEQTIGNNNIAIGKGVKMVTTGTGANNQLNIQNAIYGINNNGTGTTPSPYGRIGIGQATPVERLDVNGTTKTNNLRVNISKTTSIDRTSSVILANANTSLPTAADYTGITITVRNIGTTLITFNGSGQTINGVTTNTRQIPVGNTFKFISDGTEWYIISQI